jgi:basic membrane lipoprotein Med (substrate-binding protein (PBP1-ABC) superfamily)
MKKLVTLFAIVLTIGFGGCSSKSAAADAANAPAEEKVSAYYIGPKHDVKSAKAALEGAGFEVLAQHK